VVGKSKNRNRQVISIVGISINRKARKGKKRQEKAGTGRNTKYLNEWDNKI
jgi:hypothetical protein